jgi:carbonic anhydrase
MQKLIRGLVDFRERRLPEYAERFRELAQVQTPDALLITCSDSRIVPELVASTDPGDLFVLRNVGNLVPPATATGDSIGDVSEASAIEYAILGLNIRYVLVCGHSECGAMKAALAGKAMPNMPNFTKWLQHVSSAVSRLEQEGPYEPHLKRHDRLSQLNVLVQLEHLASYPLVRQRMAESTLHLSGLWFDIATAEVWAYDRETQAFRVIDGPFAEQLLSRFEANKLMAPSGTA